MAKTVELTPAMGAQMAREVMVRIRQRRESLHIPWTLMGVLLGVTPGVAMRRMSAKSNPYIAGTMDMLASLGLGFTNYPGLNPRLVPAEVARSPIPAYKIGSLIQCDAIVVRRSREAMLSGRSRMGTMLRHMNAAHLLGLGPAVDICEMT